MIDILSTLCYIFQHNENAKNSFRSGGGFSWTVSVLDGIGRTIQSTSDVSEAELFTFLKTLLYTLSIVLTGNIANQRYFRHDIQFSTLSDTLQSCNFIEGTKTVELCDSLLNMSVFGNWPPHCSKHPLHANLRLSAPWEPTAIFPFSESLSLSSIQQQVNGCSQCRDNLFIENPELFKLIVQLVGNATRKTNNNTTSSQTTYIHVIKELCFLCDVLPANQQRLSSISLVSDIIESFQDHVLLEPSPYVFHS